MSGRARWIPWAFVGGFAVVLAANGIMVFYALDSWTGVDRANAYKAGLAFNETIEAARQQEALGWDVDMSVTQPADGRATVLVSMTDDDGTPMNRADVRARFFRPTHGGADFETALGWIGDGRYEAQVELPLRGQWDVHVVAESRGEQWRQSKRVDLR